MERWCRNCVRNRSLFALPGVALLHGESHQRGCGVDPHSHWVQVVLGRKLVFLLAFTFLAVVEVAEAQSRQGTRKTRLREALAANGDVARDSFEVARDSLDLETTADAHKRARELDRRSTRTLAAANGDDDLRVVISLEDRQLWALIGSDTLLGVPVAVS